MVSASPGAPGLLLSLPDRGHEGPLDGVRVSGEAGCTCIFSLLGVVSSRQSVEPGGSRVDVLYSFPSFLSGGFPAGGLELALSGPGKLASHREGWPFRFQRLSSWSVARRKGSESCGLKTLPSLQSTHERTLSPGKKGPWPWCVSLQLAKSNR